MIEQYFTTEVETFGVSETIDLKPDGFSIRVTDENKSEFIRLKIQFVTKERISP